MRKMIIIPAALAMALLAGCSGIHVETDFDREADFSRYRAYRWVEHEKDTDRGLMRDPLVRKHVVRSVEEELGEMGYVPAKEGNPDFLVAWYIGTRKKIDVDHYYYRYGRWGRFRGRDTRVRRYREGTLIIDIVDARARELVWRGHARSALHGREDTAEDIRKFVEAILERFPPD